MQKVLRLSRTVSRFKSAQLGEKFNYQFKKFCYEKKLLGKNKAPLIHSFPVDFLPAFSTVSMVKRHKFFLLNRSKDFKEHVNWNFKGFGLLWNIMLNSFDYLNTEEMNADEGVKLIQSFIHDSKANKTIYDSHCISLRIINAIKFCSRFKINEPMINEFIHFQCLYLKKNPEFHLRNNHLLENGFALLFAALYFKDHSLYEFSERLLISNIPKQILPDGAHFELSGMYHLRILQRMLDSLYVLEKTEFQTSRLRKQIKSHASLMLGWIQQMQMTNGSLPAFNDSNEGFGPTLRSIFCMAARLKLDSSVVSLKESGYRKLKNRNFELIVDVNGLSPNEAPGHSHADALHFILNVFGDPFIIDTGVSTYCKGKERIYERSTMAHNTVVVANQSQSEIYDSFRVGRRANIVHLKESNNEIEAAHDGYSHLGVVHTRKIMLKSDGIEIIDKIQSKKPIKCNAFLHIDKKSGLVQKGDKFVSRFTSIEFLNSSSVSLGEGWHSPSFGMRSPCFVISTVFQNEFITRIRLNK